MYVSTFYSFKGGVGRTMALVNAAVELAQRGRKVLAVDFDLEAPGLDTFDILRPAPEAPGIIDFVGEYLTTGQAPEVERFASQSQAVANLWIMSSGTQQHYATSFGRIDWQDLYDTHDGYLLFEDLKAQWRKEIQPDYVLIDSRTGHTDTCGICTRQLPDAVTLFFFPNEQNLRGLAKVVRDIRSEAETAPKRNINTHFVMSNVPDLDDEDDILQGMLARFRADLEIEQEPLVVHRYDSLSLLNQVVFTQDRPKSRLAKEYGSVVDSVVQSNIEDKDGALHYIKQIRRNPHSPRDMEQKLARIEHLHASDGEVLYRLGVQAGDEDDWKRAKALLDRAVGLGQHEPKSILARARVLARMGEDRAASEDAKRVLMLPNLPFRSVRDAMRLIAADIIADAAILPAVTSLNPSEQLSIALELERRDEVDGGIVVLRRVLDSLADAPVREEVAEELALWLIATGELREACELLDSIGASNENAGIARTFNLAMASWGRTGNLPESAFERVVELHQAEHDDDDDGKDANYQQCMAVAYWAIGNHDSACEFAQKARSEVERTVRPTFSCWRYRTASPRQFLDDTDSIIALIRGDASMRPRFMQTLQAGNE